MARENGKRTGGVVRVFCSLVVFPHLGFLRKAYNQILANEQVQF